MRKTLLCLFALLLSATVVDAQKVAGVLNAPSNVLNKKEALRSIQPMKAPSVPNRIALDEGERLFGFYNTDELDLSGYSSLGLVQYPGSYSAGALFYSDVVSGFSNAVSGQITKVRFAVAESIGSTTVRIFPVNLAEGEIGEAVAEEAVASTQQGWNDVVLTTPVTVEENTGYIISYDYTQTSKNYPLLSDMNVNPNGETGDGFMIYGNLGQGTGWYGMSDAGNLCIQFVVKGGNYIDNDVALTKMSLAKQYFKADGELEYSFGVMNMGNDVPTSYTLELSVDGNVVETLESPIALTNTAQSVTGKLALPSGLSVGEHKVAVEVTKINGETPTENVADDKAETSFYVYSESLPRQMNLIEEYTSTACGYCPLAHQLFEKWTETRNDLIIVANHNSGMGNSDPMITTESDMLASIFLGSGLPCASFNRYYNSDEGAISITMGYNSSYHDMVIDQMLNPFIEQTNSIPTFAAVDLRADYNENTRQLNINVSGEAVADFKTFVGEDAVLTVYLLEDSIIARQISYDPYQHYENEYVHNHVLRDVVSKNVFGDAINWTDDTHYSNDFTVTLDGSWNVNNMNVVAFISRPVKDDSEVTDLWVNNANITRVLSGETGINGIVNGGEDVKEVARYSIDGTRIYAPVKGINIIKMSDGTTKKVMIAE